MAVSSQGIRGDVDKVQAFWGIRMIGEDNLKHFAQGKIPDGASGALLPTRGTP